jgi:putative DNA primase/helicase
MPGLPASTKAIATEPFSKKKWRKMIDRPHYLTDEEWQEACRLANEAKPAERSPRKSPGNGIAAGEARAGVFETRPELQSNWTMTLACASGIAPEPISWLWRGWLARGKMHIIAGQPGTGKTTIAMKMAATVSAGSRWPDGSATKQGNVVIWSGEDHPADTLVPRLEASGADLNHIFFAGEMTRGKEWRAFDPAKDIRALQAAIEEAVGGASMIIVDPIVSATAADSHKNSETRRGLQPLVDMAAKLDAALIGITHFTKGSEGRSPIDRVTGSVAFGALARVVLIAARPQDGDDGKPGSRVLMRAKSNIGQDDGGFNYDLQQVPMRERPDIIASVVYWGDAVSGNARDILAEAESVPNNEGDGERHQAAEFLTDFLSDGPKPQKEVKEAAEAHGHAWRTIRRAQKDLGIKPSKAAMTGGWAWSLPEDGHQNAKMATNPCLKNVATFGNVGHLRGLSEAVSDDLNGAVSESVDDNWKDEI